MSWPTITIKGPSLDTIRGLWRPAIGGGVVVSYVAATFLDAAAAEQLKIPAVGVLAWFFAERAATKPRP